MRILLWNTCKRAALVAGVVVLTLLAVRGYNALRLPALELWHTYRPVELSAAALDGTDWKGYLAAEERLFEAVHENVTARIEAAQRVPANRYYDGSAVYPPKLADDWNRSRILEPSGAPRGVAVMLHGLTDSPYSMRALAGRYRERGFVAVLIRLPGHGTVPAGLTDVEWEDWMAATRLAVREARAHVPAPAPLHVVGYSNGGALAMKYALDAIENERLVPPDRIVLLSPMIGVTRFARFAGLAGLPALLPRFARAAWLSIVPEFNPFKYNSFPVNGGRQSFRLSDALQAQIARLAKDGRLAQVAPVLAFQSVMDFTVSTSAVVSALYAHLPDNGSELVLFDVNRAIKFDPLLSPAAASALERLLPPLPQRHRITLVANASADTEATVERTIDAGSNTARTRPLAWAYPPQVFSLSHVAIPFPPDDPLYGYAPGPGAKRQAGISLGTLALRGERGALIVDQDFLSRINWNPFFGYLLERVDETIARPGTARLPPGAALPAVRAPPDSARDAARPWAPEPLPQTPPGP